jgi:hypothetical protein
VGWRNAGGGLGGSCASSQPLAARIARVGLHLFDRRTVEGCAGGWPQSSAWLLAARGTRPLVRSTMALCNRQTLVLSLVQSAILASPSPSPAASPSGAPSPAPAPSPAFSASPAPAPSQQLSPDLDFEFDSPAPAPSPLLEPEPSPEFDSPAPAPSPALELSPELQPPAPAPSAEPTSPSPALALSPVSRQPSLLTSCVHSYDCMPAIPFSHSRRGMACPQG